MKLKQLSIRKLSTIVEVIDKNMLVSRIMVPIAEKVDKLMVNKRENNRLVALLQPEDDMTLFGMEDWKTEEWRKIHE